MQQLEYLTNILSKKNHLDLEVKQKSSQTHLYWLH